MTEAGLLLALGCALLTNVALLCKHRGAVEAPSVAFSHPLRSAASLFGSKWWTIGFAIAFVAWALHVAALAIAPLSMVQAVIAGGLALLALPARHLFGISLGWRELTGLGLSAGGLAFLALTATDHPTSGQYEVATMAAFEGGAIMLGVALLLSGARGNAHPHGGLLLGAAAGLLIGVSDVALKALAETVPGDLAARSSAPGPPWPFSPRSAPSTRSRARSSSATPSRSSSSPRSPPTAPRSAAASSSSATRSAPTPSASPPARPPSSR